MGSKDSYSSVCEHTAILCVELFDVTEPHDELLNRNALLILLKVPAHTTSCHARLNSTQHSVCRMPLYCTLHRARAERETL